MTRTNEVKRCNRCGWKFSILTEHDPEMKFVCPHCGQTEEEMPIGLPATLAKPKHGDQFNINGQAAYLIRHKADTRGPEEWVMEAVSENPEIDGNILGSGKTAEECVSKAQQPIGITATLAKLQRDNAPTKVKSPLTQFITGRIADSKKYAEFRKLGYAIQLAENEEGEEYTELYFNDELEPIASHWGDDDLIDFRKEIEQHIAKNSAAAKGGQS